MFSRYCPLPKVYSVEFWMGDLSSNTPSLIIRIQSAPVTSASTPQPRPPSQDHPAHIVGIEMLFHNDEHFHGTRPLWTLANWPAIDELTSSESLPFLRKMCLVFDMDDAFDGFVDNGGVAKHTPLLQGKLGASAIELRRWDDRLRGAWARSG